MEVGVVEQIIIGVLIGLLPVGLVLGMMYTDYRHKLGGILYLIGGFTFIGFLIISMI